MMKANTVKLLLAAFLAVMLMVFLPLAVSAAEQNITVFVDGTELEFDVAPTVINQRTMVPMRKIFEFLGAEVQWIQEESGIRATTETLDLYMRLGKQDYTINGQTYQMDVAPVAIDGRTLVPLRAVMEAFSADVQWDQATSSVIIATAASQPTEEDLKYAQELDRTFADPFDPKHIRTSLSNVEFADLALIGSKLKVTFMTSNPKMQEFAIRINKGELIGVKPIKTGKNNYSVLNLDTLDITYPAMLEVYTRDAGEELFSSYVRRCLFLEKKGTSYSFASSKMWEHNYSMLSEWVDPRTYLSDNISEAVIDLSYTICQNLTDDYQKVLAIHDWVAENLYYDMDDYYDTGSHSFAGVDDLLVNKTSVCQGYADLVTLLIRAQGIPCRQIMGYAMGLSGTGYWTADNINRTNVNHAWNQAYVDHRWINLDTTWDSDNVYQNGKYQYGGIDYHLYFDSSEYFLSYNHKILSIK